MLAARLPGDWWVSRVVTTRARLLAAAWSASSWECAYADMVNAARWRAPTTHPVAPVPANRRDADRRLPRNPVSNCYFPTQRIDGFMRRGGPVADVGYARVSTATRKWRCNSTRYVRPGPIACSAIRASAVRSPPGQVSISVSTTSAKVMSSPSGSSIARRATTRQVLDLIDELDGARRRIPQPHRGHPHRRADGQGHADHHGRVRPTGTRHDDRAHPRWAGRRRSQRTQGRRPRKVDAADTAKARSLRDKGITAADIAKMLGVSRATIYRYLADSAA